MRKRTPQGLVLILLIPLALYLVNKFVFDSSSGLTIGGILNIKSHEMNKSLPIDVDEFTRLTKTLYSPPRQLQFNYIVRNLPKNETIYNLYMDSSKVGLLRTIRQDSSLKMLRDSNVIFMFLYSDSLGHPIGKFTLNPTDYK